MKIFISAELSHLSENTNSVATSALNDILTVRGYQFSAVDGVYKGVKERSFMLNTDSEGLDFARKIARVFGQDSILIVDNENRAMLQYMHGAHKTESIGTFKQVDNVDGLDAYSIIDGKFYTCA